MSYYNQDKDLEKGCVWNQLLKESVPLQKAEEEHGEEGKCIPSRGNTIVSVKEM